MITNDTSWEWIAMYGPVQYSTVQYSTVQYITVQYSIYTPYSKFMIDTTVDNSGHNW